MHFIKYLFSLESFASRRQILDLCLACRTSRFLPFCHRTKYATVKLWTSEQLCSLNTRGFLCVYLNKWKSNKKKHEQRESGVGKRATYEGQSKFLFVSTNTCRYHLEHEDATLGPSHRNYWPDSSISILDDVIGIFCPSPGKKKR